MREKSAFFGASTEKGCGKPSLSFHSFSPKKFKLDETEFLISKVSHFIYKWNLSQKRRKFVFLRFSTFYTAPTVITTVFISFYSFISFLLFGGEKFGGGGKSPFLGGRQGLSVTFLPLNKKVTK